MIEDDTLRPDEDINDDDIPNGFCIQGEFNPSCREMTFYELPDEKDVIVLILEYFKRFLPQVLKRKSDYYNQTIVIDPKDIDLISRPDYGKYVVVLSITDDNSLYPDNDFQREISTYAFQIDLQVQADDMLASLENLMKLKSAVKTLLINMENNLRLTTVIDGFSYGQYGLDESNRYVRQGIYRFSIESDNYKE